MLKILELWRIGRQHGLFKRRLVQCSRAFLPTDNRQPALPCPCRCKRPYVGFCLRIRELAEFDLHASLDGSHFVAGLETSEIGPVLPRPWTAEFHAGLDGGVMHDVDLALIVRIALLIAGEIPEIAAGGKNRVHPRNLGNLCKARAPPELLWHGGRCAKPSRPRPRYCWRAASRSI